MLLTPTPAGRLTTIARDDNIEKERQEATRRREEKRREPPPSSPFPIAASFSAFGGIPKRQSRLSTEPTLAGWLAELGWVGLGYAMLCYGTERVAADAQTGRASNIAQN